MTIRHETKAPASTTRRSPKLRRRTPVQRESDHRLNAMGKAFSILEIVAAARQPLTMAEILRATGLTKPTAHRITAALSDMGLIERDRLLGGFVEGPRLTTLALDVLQASAPRSVRHAILKAVSDETGETCNLGVLAGSEVIYIDRVEAKWPLGLRFEAGSRVPAHCTAIGKLLLSRLSPRDRRAVLATLPLARYTSRTLVDTAALAAELDRIAASDISVDNGEFIDGVVCVAVPVITGTGRVLGGIAVSAPEARISLDQARGFVDTMRAAAERLAATFTKTDAG
jgi:DNA-binding IclR family transcriptional regulator